MTGLSSLAVPIILAIVGAVGLGRKTDVFSALSDGAKQGLSVTARILPSLAVLLTAIYMLRASGFPEILAAALSPVLKLLKIPPETVTLLLIRPLSGSGALAAASDIINEYGADSVIGRTAAVMLGSTETTFYTIAVYFGAAGVKGTRWAIPAALCADAVSFITAALTVRLLW